MRVVDETASETFPEVEELTLEEGRELVDRMSQSLLGVPGEDFARRWSLGEYDHDDRPAVWSVAALLPFAR